MKSPFFQGPHLQKGGLTTGPPSGVLQMLRRHVCQRLEASRSPGSAAVAQRSFDRIDGGSGSGAELPC